MKYFVFLILFCCSLFSEEQKITISDYKTIIEVNTKKILLEIPKKYQNNFIEITATDSNINLNSSILLKTSSTLVTQIDSETLEIDVLNYTRDFSFLHVKIYDASIFSNKLFERYLYYGIAFGVLGTIIVYSLVSFIYMRIRSYLYYAIMQSFSLFYLLIFSNFINLDDFFLDISLFFATLFAVLFGLEFLQLRKIGNIKNIKQLIIYVILVEIVVFIVFYHYMLFEFLPYSLLYFILFFSLFNSYRKGLTSALFFILLLTAVLVFVFYLVEYKVLFNENSLIEIILFAFPVETLIFTFTIAHRYRLLQNENKKNIQTLLHQSRLAKTGEMIANITHQWRQPLNNISYILMNIKSKYNNNTLTADYFEKKNTQANMQLQYMSKTIDDFKEFYSPLKEKTIFSLENAVKSAILINNETYKYHNIKLNLEVKSDFSVEGYKNEFSQVVLSLLTNAQEALINIKDKKVKIVINENDEYSFIYILDNGHGISYKNMDNIFKQYYSTKEEGTGLGLYMSKLIIEQNMEGELFAKNISEGAKFVIRFKK